MNKNYKENIVLSIESDSILFFKGIHIIAGSPENA